MGGDSSTDRYRLVAPCYEVMSRMYGGRRAGRCRHAFVDRIAPGERVLFAGVGPGTDAVAAVQRGALVTAVDRSAAMLRRCAANLRAAGVAEHATLVECDARTLEEAPQFDWVFANFFLSGFAEAEMCSMLHHLARLLRVRGHLVIGDFAAPAGKRLGRALQHLHWYTALLPLAVLARHPLHSLFDYARYLPAASLQVVTVEQQRALGVPLYASTLARRFANEPTTAAKRPETVAVAPRGGGNARG